MLKEVLLGAVRAWPLLILLAPASGFAHDEKALRQIADSRYWHLLVHYKKSILLQTKGESGSPSFYFSPDGRSDPYRELVATLEAFTQNTQEVGPRKQHPQCAFPERFRFLKEALHFQLKEEVCTSFLEWKARFNPTSVTVVFATAYLNNSATMFGHTFLRVDSKPRLDSKKKNDLLDYGLNFGAGMVPGGGAINALLGLTGGLPGFFSLMPYSDKVHEYSDTESRDMWEYKLSLNEEQISRMINHTWELASTFFPYYFFDKNCAYHLLALLEVANPDWQLTDQFVYWVIPSDTIRALSQIKGAIVAATLRPSLYRQLKQKLQALTESEKIAFERSSGKTLRLDGQESSLVLDTLLDFHEYSLMRADKQKDEADLELQRRLLVARARQSASSPVLPPILANNRPDLGIGSEKFSFYGGSKNAGRAYSGLQLRPAFHDLYDLDDGFLHFSEINLFRTDLRYYYQPRQFRVHEFELVELTSLPAVDQISRGMSWTTADGLYSPPDLDCKNCVAARVSGGLGYSAYLPASREGMLFSSLLKANVEYSGWFSQNFRMGPSLLAQVLADVSTFGKAGVAGEIFYYPTQNSQQRVYEKVTAQVAGNPFVSVVRNFELRGLASYYFLARGNYLDVSGALSLYF